MCQIIEHTLSEDGWDLTTANICDRCDTEGAKFSHTREEWLCDECIEYFMDKQVQKNPFLEQGDDSNEEYNELYNLLYNEI